MERDDSVYLQHILDAISRIEEYLLEHRISAGKAAELLGIRKREFLRLMACKGISYFDYSDEELENEFRAADEWKKSGCAA